jgi:hypothetical protein
MMETMVSSLDPVSANPIVMRGIRMMLPHLLRDMERLDPDSLTQAMGFVAILFARVTDPLPNAFTLEDQVSATIQGQVTQNRIAEHPNGVESGQATQTGDSDSATGGGQVEAQAS